MGQGVMAGRCLGAESVLAPSFRRAGSPHSGLSAARDEDYDHSPRAAMSRRVSPTSDKESERGRSTVHASHHRQ